MGGVERGIRLILCVIEGITAHLQNSSRFWYDVDVKTRELSCEKSDSQGLKIYSKLK